MKKAMLVGISVFLCFSLCGCFDKQEVGNMAYLIALGVDKNNEYTFQFASFDGELKLENYTSSGDNIYTALNKINGQFAKKIVFSQLRVVVFSDNLKSYELREQLDFFIENPDINPGVSLGVCKDEVKKYMEEKNSGMEVLPTRYYEKVFNPEYTVYAPKTTIRDLERKEYNVFPYASDTLEGMIIYGNNRILGKSNGYEARIYNMLTEKLSDLKYDYEQDGKTMVVSLSSLKPVCSVTFEDSLIITINLNFDCEPLINEKYFDKSKLEMVLEDEISEYLYKSSRMFKADIFNFENDAKKYYLTATDWKNEDWNGLYSNAEFNVNANINTVRK